MKTHDLKIHKPFLKDVISLKKKFEIRKDDRNYRVGDLIIFKTITFFGTWDKHHETTFQITHIFRNHEAFGLKNGYVILSIKPF